MKHLFYFVLLEDFATRGVITEWTLRLESFHAPFSRFHTAEFILGLLTVAFNRQWTLSLEVVIGTGIHLVFDPLEELGRVFDGRVFDGRVVFGRVLDPD